MVRLLERNHSDQITVELAQELALVALAYAHYQTSTI